MWNRIAALMVLVATSSLLVAPFEIEARGGGGGGGRGSGGGGRGGGGNRGGSYAGGQTMNRTPTMSRATGKLPASQSRPQTRQQPVARAKTSQGNAKQDRQAAQQRAPAANRTELRSQVNQYAQGSERPNINRQDSAQRAKEFSSNRNNQYAQNRQLSNSVSQRLQQSRPDSNKWFDRNFFDSHNIDVDYARGANLWRPAAWASLATWGAWNWSTPYYYDNYGYTYPVTDESTYSSSTPTYTNSTASSPPVQSSPSAQNNAAGGDWLPLGVFALASNANAAAQSNHFIQLAINRSGEMSGVLFNSTTDTAQDLTGTVNQENQKAYWSLANKPGAPVASTGIYNLTEDQTPINVKFSDGSDQTWALVRIQQ